MESAEPIRPGAKASVIGEETGWMQPMDFPGSQRATCRQGTVNESSEPLVGRLGVAVSTHSEGIAYKPLCGEIAMCRRVGRMGPIK